MTTLRSAFRGLAAAGALFCATGAAAQTGGPSEGFVFCARPPRPSCLAAPESYASPETAGRCRQALNRYVDQTFRYRDCLEREIRRAVIEVNEALARDRCRAARRKNCP